MNTFHWLIDCVHKISVYVFTLFTGGRDSGKNNLAEILGYKEIINSSYLLGNHEFLYE